MFNRLLSQEKILFQLYLGKLNIFHLNQFSALLRCILFTILVTEYLGKWPILLILIFISRETCLGYCSSATLLDMLKNAFLCRIMRHCKKVSKDSKGIIHYQQFISFQTFIQRGPCSLQKYSRRRLRIISYYSGLSLLRLRLRRISS